MEITIKEYLNNLQQEFRVPLRIREVKRTEYGKITYIYIITNRDTQEKEGLKLALPYLLEGIANRWDIYEIGMTYTGTLYLITEDTNQDDLGILYHDITYIEELPEINLTRGEELSRYIFFSLVDETHAEAYIIPEDLLRRDPINE
ncbi:hypothetical protein Metvu_1755 (plasmid) [Methanocaldococcus vulcanius M7]|uniref:Uncharacterized protein n=1 Tax=Methanocaldococcus vulcanius (strain ATCC 700851 / DSM 12094 / M7) TaxID=579137 RepID=C9RIG8_METVM|nr:hypothetical protein [Methanocaldococcus vulcanius]ACX73605.1 hypothetical protein Metvu_1755 [Methanocaldococcus vulcanius M7]